MPGVLNWPIQPREAPSRFLQSAALIGSLLVTLAAVFVVVVAYRQYDENQEQLRRDALMRQFIADVVSVEGEGVFSEDEDGRLFCGEMQKRLSGDSSVYDNPPVSKAVAREFLLKLC